MFEKKHVPELDLIMLEKKEKLMQKCQLVQK